MTNEEIENDMLKLVQYVEDLFPKTIFRPVTKESPPDCYTAEGCRHACNLIRNEIIEYFENK